MPNLGAVLKAEITRLSRKEIRSELEATRKSSAQQRSYIAELRRQMAALERQVAVLSRRGKATSASAPDAVPAKPTRFAAKGLRSNRERLGLSATDYGRLVGVSAQSIYNWESEATEPREAQKAKLATLRGIGAREARDRLSELDQSAG